VQTTVQGAVQTGSPTASRPGTVSPRHATRVTLRGAPFRIAISNLTSNLVTGIADTGRE